MVSPIRSSPPPPVVRVSDKSLAQEYPRCAGHLSNYLHPTLQDGHMSVYTNRDGSIRAIWKPTGGEPVELIQAPGACRSGGV
jgi:hypothetical protein